MRSKSLGEASPRPPLRETPPASGRRFINNRPRRVRFVNTPRRSGSYQQSGAYNSPRRSRMGSASFTEARIQRQSTSCCAASSSRQSGTVRRTRSASM